MNEKKGVYFDRFKSKALKKICLFVLYTSFKLDFFQLNSYFLSKFFFCYNSYNSIKNERFFFHKATGIFIVFLKIKMFFHFLKSKTNVFVCFFRGLKTSNLQITQKTIKCNSLIIFVSKISIPTIKYIFCFFLSMKHSCHDGFNEIRN